MMFRVTRIKNKATEDRVHLCGNNLISVSNTKFLGVIIDSKLNWSDHITYIKNKMYKSIGIFTKIRRFLNKKTLRNLYFSFVYPYLTYCVEVWGNTHATYLNPLIKLQKKVCTHYYILSLFRTYTTSF